MDWETYEKANNEFVFEVFVIKVVVILSDVCWDWKYPNEIVL